MFMLRVYERTRRRPLVRNLPGTGSKTGACGISGTTEVICFGAASQPIVAVATS
ncbi:hypothetical protein ALQ32_05450 [Pseudomonas syringae pv. tagetis]|uniref:Uncharacterized protein n=1 Tax=Pseudomonas syringae pv. tagetis TaxID=129140 RepID=A0A3M3YQ43_9PSED|nr:hypothetical protein ALQ32_05450 [Pseudomonas syringae pv. tagetis]